MDCSEVRDDRMDALYGEAGAEALQRVDAHHAACPACSGEFDELLRLRSKLQVWRLPERFRAWPEPRRRRPLVALAAAAGLLLALGAAVHLSGASFEFRAGPLAFSLGGEEVAARLQQQEARHRREIEALRVSLAALESRPASASADGALLAQVERLIRENEEQQARRLNAAVEQFAARAEAQRRYDLARISAGLSYLDGKTGQHVARTSELMGYMLQASQKR